MIIQNMTSADIATICEGLVMQMQNEPSNGPAFRVWSKIAMQAFDYTDEEYEDAVKQLQSAVDSDQN